MSGSIDSIARALAKLIPQQNRYDYDETSASCSMPIKAHALLHRTAAGMDDKGHIVATVENDYKWSVN